MLPKLHTCRTVVTHRCNRGQHVPLWPAVTWTPRTAQQLGRWHFPPVECTGCSWRRSQRRACALRLNRSILKKSRLSDRDDAVLLPLAWYKGDLQPDCMSMDVFQCSSFVFLFSESYFQSRCWSYLFWGFLQCKALFAPLKTHAFLN